MAKRKPARAAKKAKKPAQKKAARTAARTAAKRKATPRRVAAKKKAATKKKAAPAKKTAPPKKKAAPKKRAAPARKATPKKAALKKAAPKKAAAPAKKAAPKAKAAPKQATARNPTPVERKAPSLNRARRVVLDDDIVMSPPSSLDLDRTASAARSGRRALHDRLDQHHETGPAMTGGDVDADWESAYSVGDEAPGGDNPTPDQDIVDDIGRALGNEYQDNEPLKGADKIAQRDKHRWELDPGSKEDFDDADIDLPVVDDDEDDEI
jgi:hypothetical protein